MKYFLLILSIFIVSGCSQKVSQNEGLTSKKIKSKGYKPYDSTIEVKPLSVYKLNDTLFIDRSEISNIRYKLFQDFYDQIYGIDSEIAKSLMPNSKVWRDVNDPILLTSGEYSDSAKLYEGEYFTNASFNDHPVVGISYKQAIMYSEWRTKRALERILIEQGYKKSVQGYEEFNVDDYFNHKYQNVHVVDNLRFPYYYLIDDTEPLKKLEPGYVYSYSHHLRYLEDNELQYTLPSFKATYEPERLLGNVAEMTATEGVAFGGSWVHPLAECHLDSIQTYDGPKNWLGFRNMCRIVSYDEYKKLGAN